MPLAFAGRLDDAHVVEQEHDLGAELALAEQHAHVRRRAIAVVGQALDHHGHVVGRVALDGDQLHHRPVRTATRATLDGALDHIVRHGLLARRLDGHFQARVVRRVRHAGLGGDGDFAHQLGGDGSPLVSGDLFLCVQPLTSHGGRSYTIRCRATVSEDPAGSSARTLDTVQASQP